MKSNFETCFNDVIKTEGGYVNDPVDPGGMTNLGVTRAAYESYLGHVVTEQEMRDLTPETVMPFYKEKYWDAVMGDELPEGVDYAVYDVAVNSGIKWAIHFLQEALETGVDGKMGPITLKLAQEADPKQLITKICQIRENFLQHERTFWKYGRGWTNRVNSVETIASKMAS